jgi:hypothetical protein
MNFWIEDCDVEAWNEAGEGWMALDPDGEGAAARALWVNGEA